MASTNIVESNSLVGTATLIRTGQVFVNFVTAINTTAAAAYIQLFDAAAAADVTPGTTVARLVFKSAANDPMDPPHLPEDGVRFLLGVVAISTTTATGSTGASQHLRVGIR